MSYQTIAYAQAKATAYYLDGSINTATASATSQAGCGISYTEAQRDANTRARALAEAQVRAIPSLSPLQYVNAILIDTVNVISSNIRYNSAMVSSITSILGGNFYNPAVGNTVVSISGTYNGNSGGVVLASSILPNGNETQYVPVTNTICSNVNYVTKCRVIPTATGYSLTNASGFLYTAPSTYAGYYNNTLLGTNVTTFDADNGAVVYLATTGAGVNAATQAYIINTRTSAVSTANGIKIVVPVPNSSTGAVYTTVNVRDISYATGSSWVIVGAVSTSANVQTYDSNGLPVLFGSAFIANIDLSSAGATVIATNVLLLNSYDNATFSMATSLSNVTGDNNRYNVSYVSDNTNSIGSTSTILRVDGYYCGNVGYQIKNNLQIQNPNFGSSVTTVTGIIGDFSERILGTLGNRSGENPYNLENIVPFVGLIGTNL